MPDFEMHWSVGTNQQTETGTNYSPTLGDIRTLLPSMMSSSGKITVHIKGATSSGPQLLTMEVDQGHILFSLLQGDDEHDSVRLYQGSGTGMIEIRGNTWTSNIVCSDPSVALRVFKEFLDTGDVSTAVLN